MDHKCSKYLDNSPVLDDLGGLLLHLLPEGLAQLGDHQLAGHDRAAEDLRVGPLVAAGLLLLEVVKQRADVGAREH